MKLSDKTYDTLKWLAIFFIPGLASLAGVIGMALHYEYTSTVVLIVNAVGNFVATCIGMSIKEYEKTKKEQYEGNTDGEQ